jgi:hypothetical protein
MTKTLFDLYTEVLGKVSLVDPRIFRKELRKAFRQLQPAERDELKKWFRTSCICKWQRPKLIPVPVRSR